MCNLYRHRMGPSAILDITRAMRGDVGNLEPRDIYPDGAVKLIGKYSLRAGCPLEKLS